MVGVGKDLCGSSSPTPCRSRVTYSRLHRTLSRWVLNISREGDSTTSLGSLFQCSITLRGKKFFLMFRWNFLGFSLCPLPLVLSLGTTEKSLAPSWHYVTSYYLSNQIWFQKRKGEMDVILHYLFRASGAAHWNSSQLQKLEWPQCYSIWHKCWTNLWLSRWWGNSIRTLKHTFTDSSVNLMDEVIPFQWQEILRFLCW